MVQIKRNGSPDLRFDTQAGAMANLGSNRHAIVAGHPEQSELIRRITSTDPDEQMPPRSLDRHILSRQKGAKFAGGVEMHDGAPVLQERDATNSGISNSVESARHSRRKSKNVTGFESRSVVLGHIQRGGSPSAFDRVLATRYGLGAIDMVHREEWGKMAALRGNKIISIPLSEAIASNRKVDQEILDAAIGILDKLEEKTETAS